jgi:GntR family transcriptional regulator
VTGRSRSSPKRTQIREHLLDLVETLPTDAAVPSERALCAELGVSRPTVRSAVDDLVRDGVLVRRHGLGMFVARPKIAQDIDSARGSRLAVDGAWTSRTLEFRRITAGPRIGRRLQVSPGEVVIRARRLRLADREPIAVDTLHVPAALVPGLTPDDLELHSFYGLIEERYGISVTEALQVIEPTVADEDEAALLGVPVYAPALLFERVTEDAAGRVVEFTHSIYRGDRYRVVSRLALAPRPEGGRLLSGNWSTAAFLPGADTLTADPYWQAETHVGRAAH